MVLVTIVGGTQVLVYLFIIVGVIGHTLTVLMDLFIIVGGTHLCFWYVFLELWVTNQHGKSDAQDFSYG